ncbi:MAG TPA: slipin family protein [Anaerolineae bacterium]|nr:slipin family protein [Anaerolineae bacterium]
MLDALFSSGGLVLLSLIILLIVILTAAIKILPEWERGVILRLGRLSGVKGPGLVVIIPFIDRIIRVSTRVVTLDVPQQRVITLDNVTIEVDAVVFYRVVDPAKSVVAVEDFRRASFFVTQTTLRNVIGQSEMDELLARRERINEKLQVIIDEATEPWGVKVGAVEVRDVRLPDTMQRAMAAQAEAERVKRAKVIHAEGEYQAAQRLAEAAGRMAEQPAALQLRYLQTLTEIAAEKNSTIIFPLPLEYLKGFERLLAERPK